MRETSVIEINLAAVSQNVQLLKRIIGSNCLLCPIVKADAYGLGAVRVAKTLLSSGADMLAVYTAAQAAELMRGAISGSILVLSPVREVERVDDLYRGLICGRLHLTVHDEGHLNDLIILAERYGAPIPVHLEVDTGMTRGGCAIEDAPRLLRRIALHPRLNLAGLFTHFANAESDVEFTDRQLALFDDLIDRCKADIPTSCLIHAASTFATLRSNRFHKSMVRVGLAWAGYGMEEIDGGEVIAEGQHLQPCVTWRSHIVQLRSIHAGTHVGYGSRWTALRDSVIALVPVGYADGYPVRAGRVDEGGKTSSVAVLARSSSGGTAVPRFAPVVGAVNMDQITVDVTDVVADCAVAVGTEVELITPDSSAPNHLPRLADCGGTFAHDMLCRLNPRLKRHYTMNATSGEQIIAPRAVAVRAV
ncbi:MAG TPA: alanine racemase [Phycisphaerales bacterium]|nr:alanine racemase [Phycisphaerales bacterium]HRQ74573.1 alanine racemase [Phycisphaerales bacterium]